MYSSSFADVFARWDGMNLALPVLIASSNVKKTELLQVIIKPRFQISTDNNGYQQIPAAFKETVATVMF